MYDSINKMDEIKKELSEIEQEKKQLVEEIKNELDERFKSDSSYIIPFSRTTKADMIKKLVKAASTLGLYLDRDVIYALGLKRGQLVRVTLELLPSEKAKMEESYTEERVAPKPIKSLPADMQMIQ